MTGEFTEWDNKTQSFKGRGGDVVTKNKNGIVVNCSSHANSYKLLRTSLTRFCRSKYNRTLSSYNFRDINEEFLLDYTLYIKKIAARKGNKGGLTVKLKLIRAMCNLATKMGMPCTPLITFDCLGDNIKWDTTSSKAISKEKIIKIINVDRSAFTKVENFLIYMNVS